MSRNFEEIIETLTKKGQGIVVAVGGTFTGFRELTNTKKQLDDRIYNLGLQVYEEYSNKPTTTVYKKYAEQFKEIAGLSELEETLEEELANKFGKKICPNCGEMIDIDNHFCHHCGNEQEFEEEEEEIQEEDLACPNCGAEYEEGQKFCKCCGTNLSE